MFKRLEYVYTVYQEKSFTKAAEKLFVSQPSLSAAIKKTEEEIGEPLFERGNNIQLTEIGKEYIRIGEQILQLQKDFSTYMEDRNNLLRGRLSLGGSNYVSAYILPRLITRFSSRFPNISVTLREAHSLDLQKQIQNEETDLILDNLETVPDTYQCYPLKKEEIFLAVPKGEPINEALKDYRFTPSQIYHREPLNAEALPIRTFKDLKFIILKSGYDMHRQAMHIFKSGGITPEILLSLDQLFTSYTLVESGLGSAFVTDRLFLSHAFADEVFLYRITESHGRTLSVVHKKNRYCSRAMQEFIRIAQEMIQ